MFHTSHSISWRLPPPRAAAALLLCLRYQSCCCGAAAAKNLTTIKCHFLPRNLFLHFIRCQYNLQSSEFCPLALTALIHLHSSPHSGSLSAGAIAWALSGLIQLCRSTTGCPQKKLILPSNSLKMQILDNSGFSKLRTK